MNISTFAFIPQDSSPRLKYKTSPFTEKRFICVSNVDVGKPRQQKQPHSRDWTLVASGTRITAEFEAFLKELLRQLYCYIAEHYCMNGKQFQSQYKEHLSDY